MARRVKVGVQLHPQQTSLADLRAAWREADGLGVDSLWLWDHFFPIYGDREGPSFEGWTTLAAMAADTTTATVGVLVTSIGYRNPDLLADMARTVDHISGGRAVLGIGAGWFERDYAEYGYPFGQASDRLRALGQALPRLRRRLGRLVPPPLQDPLPLLIGGGGEKVTLRLVAEHAQMWNTFGPPESYAHKNRVLDDWCARVGRDGKEIERTVLCNSPEDAYRVEEYLAAGVQHVILGRAAPFDLGPARRLLELAESAG